MDVKQIRLQALQRLIDEDKGGDRGKKARTAQRIGKSPAQLSQWLSGYRSIDEESARDIEARARKPRGWMDTIIASEPAHTYFNNVVEGAGDGQKIDQFLSDLTASISHSVEWGSIVPLKRLPPQFVSTVPDDAMCDHVRAGTRCIFRAASTSSIGQGVLVVDKHKQLHLRMHTEGDGPHHWIAAADNKAYRSYDSIKDELRVVAVFEHALKGWNER